MSRRESLLKPRLAAGLGAALVLVAGFTLLNLNSRLGSALRFASYDWAYDLSFVKQPPPSADAITMIYLDEASYVDFQQPFNQPWDRRIHARLLDRLAADGARAVIFDVVFSDPGPDAEADKMFAAAIRRNGRVILAADRSENHSTSDLHGRSVEQTLVLPYAPFAEAAAGWGIAQLQPDEDFLVREHNHGPRGEKYTSMTWAAAKLLHLPAAANDAERFQERWINYYTGPDNFQGLSYKLAFDKPAGFYRDKIIFIGGSPQTGLLRERKDQFRSPYTTWYSNPVFTPAVDVHATILLNLIGADWLHRLPPAGEWAAILVGTWVFGAGLMRFRPLTAVGVAALGVLVFGGVVLLLFGLGHVWFPWLVVVAVQAPLGLLITISYKSVEWYVLRKTLERQREQAQRQIYEQAALLDKAQDAIMVHDLDWHSTYWNPSAERLLGWTAAEARTRNVQELLYKKHAAKFAEARAAVLHAGEWVGQLPQTTKAGKDLLVESRWTRVCDAAGKINSVLVINTDITERSKLESQLLRTQRLESIGTLAGGIAHDLNNVLTPILLGVEILANDEKVEYRKKTLNTIGISAKRGADMVKQVLSFTRGREGDKAPLQIKHVIRDLEKILRETFPKNLELKVNLSADLPPMVGDVTQLHQVLLNLCVNARDAMPDGGQLQVAAGKIHLTAAEARHFLGATAGNYLRLRVQDTGMGIPQAIIDRIFEPFFTTKEVGKGTGLGLSTVLSIVKNHGAFMDVSSVVGQGTTFTILFPLNESATVAPAAEIQAPVAAGAGRLVLVVDDEALIRDLLRSVLTGQGYRVIVAEDGARAVELFQNHAAEISLVMIDLMMPVLDGYRAIAAMHQLRRDTKFMAMSGMIQAEKFEALAAITKVEILNKPFSGQKVLETLTRIL
jgi:PAS domain S-box-containing protein